MKKFMVFLMVLVSVSGFASSITVFEDFATLEYQNKNVFMFLDKGKDFEYGELSVDAEIGRGIFASYANEFGRFKTRHLVGIGFNANVKPFNWLKVVQYQRLESRDWQTTVVWGICKGKFQLDGVADKVDGNIFHSTQLKYSISSDISIGVEFSNANRKPTMAFLQYKF